jgi:CrcB protein
MAMPKPLNHYAIAAKRGKGFGMLNLLLVMLGGATGSLARYGVSVWARHLWPTSEWPIGTFIANLLGGLLMGLLTGALLWPLKHVSLGPIDAERLRLLLGVGVLGGFTTFSSFSLETVFMIERRHYLMALGYAVLSVGLAVGGVMLGLVLMRKVA